MDFMDKNLVIGRGWAIFNERSWHQKVGKWEGGKDYKFELQVVSSSPRYFYLALGGACALLESRIYPVLGRWLRTSGTA